MTKDEALKLAIDALLYGTNHTKAVTACQEALEQQGTTLSDDKIKDMFGVAMQGGVKGYEGIVKFARAIEKKVRGE